MGADRARRRGAVDLQNIDEHLPVTVLQCRILKNKKKFLSTTSKFIIYLLHLLLHQQQLHEDVKNYKNVRNQNKKINCKF